MSDGEQKIAGASTGQVEQDAPIAYRPRRVAKLLDLSLSATYLYIQQSIIPSVKIGGSVRVLRSDLEAYLARERARRDAAKEADESLHKELPSEGGSGKSWLVQQ